MATEQQPSFRQSNLHFFEVIELLMYKLHFIKLLSIARENVANWELFQDKAKQDELVKKGISSSEMAEVSVKVYFTPEYAQEVGGKVQEDIESLVAKANVGYANTGVSALTLYFTTLLSLIAFAAI